MFEFFDIGPVVFVVPYRRVSAAWFFGLLAAVLGFAVLVLLVVVTSCGGDRTAVPEERGVSQTRVAGECYPFCGVAPTPLTPSEE
ncbi:hypothetical protein LTV02_25000 [Nocardia yamanashiensis]|uniref:hypothetical protein n=1 Tax=Nocardia yamanashiensis TaxID=209247 RepID=UPI001E46372A|nr:hypothetical protein [Nocardia yamanashiensis]UGT39322.1 hypothetical protein LTV02_25000 [Nocardia yamanashiensis]